MQIVRYETDPGSGFTYAVYDDGSRTIALNIGGQTDPNSTNSYGGQMDLNSLDGWVPNFSQGPVTIPSYVSSADLSRYQGAQTGGDFGDNLLNFITAPFRVIGASIDGAIDRAIMPYNVVPQSPYGVSYVPGTQPVPYGVPPGTVPGPTYSNPSAWLKSPVVGTVTGEQVLFGIAALVGLVLVAKAVK